MTRQELHLPADRVGVVVRDVLGADPGVDDIEEGDLVVEINRRPTPDVAAYRRVLASLEPGAARLALRLPPAADELVPDARLRGAAPLKPRVLIIDDEDAVRSSLKMIFEYEGYETLQAANGPVGLKLAEQEAPDLVFLDVRMPQLDGLDVLKRLKEKDPALPVVILSGHGTVKTAVEAMKLGAFDFIEKPPEQRAHPDRGPERPRPQEARRGEPQAAARVRRPLPHGGGEPGAAEGLGGRAARGADERHRADHGRERRRQGARRPRDPPELACAPTRPSSRSTARRSPRS